MSYATAFITCHTEQVRDWRPLHRSQRAMSVGLSQPQPNRSNISEARTRPACYISIIDAQRRGVTCPCRKLRLGYSGGVARPR